MNGLRKRAWLDRIDVLMVLLLEDGSEGKGRSNWKWQMEEVQWSKIGL